MANRTICLDPNQNGGCRQDRLWFVATLEAGRPAVFIPSGFRFPSFSEPIHDMAVVAAFPATPSALAATYCKRGYDTRSPGVDDLSGESKNGCRCVKRSRNSLDCLNGCNCEVLNCRSENVCGAILTNEFYFEGESALPRGLKLPLGRQSSASMCSDRTWFCPLSLLLSPQTGDVLLLALSAQSNH